MIGLTKVNDHSTLGINGQGHAYAGVVVAFLIVSRVNTTIARYNECRGYIGIMYRETRELLQTAYVLTLRDKNVSQQHMEWRAELAYRTMVMLRSVIAVIEYNSNKVAAWKIDELSGYELEYVSPAPSWRKYALSANTERRESMRVPTQLCFLVRETIASNNSRLGKALLPNHEIKLLGTVDSFMTGWYGMTKFMTTPAPFPLIQMTRTLVLIYVYTLPFVFLKDNPEHEMFEHCVILFLLTYSFLGLELASIELDDPFGKDPNDLDCVTYARGAFEDIYLMIHDTDGPEMADFVYRRMNSRERSTDDGSRIPGERSQLLSPQEESVV